MHEEFPCRFVFIQEQHVTKGMRAGSLTSLSLTSLESCWNSL
uniref:Uncharacterized protein n=1 Tax=Anguilla anguilla TaxID=7936 RepID=A0A0E9VXV6_ANGAN